MQYYVSFTSDGNISGFYNDDVHGSAIPAGSLPITQEEWAAYVVEGGQLYKLDGTTIRLKTQAELDAEKAARPITPKTPDQIKIEQMKLENEQMNMSIIELWENIIPLLPA